MRKPFQFQMNTSTSKVDKTLVAIMDAISVTSFFAVFVNYTLSTTVFIAMALT